MSAADLRAKLTYDESQRRAYHLRLAISCRQAARLNPQHAAGLRAKMRSHALRLAPSAG